MIWHLCFWCAAPVADEREAATAAMSPQQQHAAYTAALARKISLETRNLKVDAATQNVLNQGPPPGYTGGTTHAAPPPTAKLTARQRGSTAMQALQYAFNRDSIPMCTIVFIQPCFCCHVSLQNRASAKRCDQSSSGLARQQFVIRDRAHAHA